MEPITKLKSILSRLSETDYSELLGEQAIKILNLQSGKELYLKDLKEAMLDLYGESFFLTNKNARRILFQSLKLEEAKEVAGILNSSFQKPEDLYGKIISKNLKKDSPRIEKLYEYFGVELKRGEIESGIRVENADILPAYAMFSHQRKASQKITEYLNTPPHRAMLHMPTGSGKTRTAMNIICDYLRQNENHLVIWLATTEELCQQAYEEFEKAWSVLGNRKVDIYKLWGNSSVDDIKSTDGIVIAGFPKLNGILNKSHKGLQSFMDLSTKFDFIVMDEAHQAIAPTYKFILDAIFTVPSANKVKKLLGLSATPGRTYSDIEEDEKLSNFFARRKVTLEIMGYENPVDYLISEGYLAKVKYRNIKYRNEDSQIEYMLNDVVEIPSHILKKLGNDEKRNLQVILHCEKLTKQHQRIIVFAPSVESSNLIALILRRNGYKAFSLTSETDYFARKDAIEDYKDEEPIPKILVNYGILTTGFDAPRTSAAVIARPTMSLVLYSQMIGRAIRGVRAGGNKEAEILTVIDDSLPGFNNVAEAFFNWEDVWEDE